MTTNNTFLKLPVSNFSSIKTFVHLTKQTYFLKIFVLLQQNPPINEIKTENGFAVMPPDMQVS
jgi:hypothetical protein